MNTEKATHIRTIDLLYSAFFAVLIAVCAWISVPTLIPFTLQTFGIFTALCTLGGKRGTAAIVVYLALGALGLPVFSNFSGGLGQLIGTTGGYLLGFLFTGLIYWLITSIFGRKLWAEIIALIFGLAAVYAFGTLWYTVAYAGNSGSIGFGAALSTCVVPFIVPDLVKMALALAISKKLRKLLK